MFERESVQNPDSRQMGLGLGGNGGLGCCKMYSKTYFGDKI